MGRMAQLKITDWMFHFFQLDYPAQLCCKLGCPVRKFESLTILSINLKSKSDPEFFGTLGLSSQRVLFHFHFGFGHFDTSSDPERDIYMYDLFLNMGGRIFP